MSAPLCRRELPTEEAPLIINFGAPFHLFAPGDSRRHLDPASFITGAYDTYQLVESVGASSGVQVNFTLLGIRLLVGRPIEDMKNRAFAPEEIFGEFARELTHRLYDATSWDARFECLDHALAMRMATRWTCPRVCVARGTGWLPRAGGRASPPSCRRSAGARALHRTVQARIGVSPKVFARMLRFGRVVRAIRAGQTADLADLAVASGYYDQSHLNRDVREFAGTTPGELLESLLPDGGGFAV